MEKQEVNMDFDIEIETEIEPLPLKDLGVINIASHVWDLRLPIITKAIINAKKTGKLKPPIWNYPKGENNSYSEKLKFKIIKDIPLVTDFKCCPKVATIATQTKILDLFDQIYDWILHVTEDLKFHMSYVEKIYFTSRGTIDTVRIFRSHWINIAGPQPEGWFFQKFNPLHLLSCLFDIEYLSHFQTDIINEIVSIFPGFQIDPNSNPTFRIMSVVIYCYSKFLEGRGYDTIVVNGLNEANLTANAMVEICRSYAFYEPFTYFYNQLNDIEELSFLESISKKTFGSYLSKIYYKKENEFLIAIFLLKKMTDTNLKYDFIFCNFPFIFFHFLKKESYKKFCFRLVRTFLLRHCNKHNSPEDFLKNFVNVLTNILKLGYDSQFHLQVFQTLMKNIPMNNKIEIFSRFQSNLIDDLYDIFYTPALRVIINDPDLEKQKARMINQGKMKFKSLIEEKNYKAMDKFVVEVLSSKTLHDEFHKTITESMEVWIMNFHFHFLDNYLAWKYEERAREFKTQLYPLWCSLVPKIYVNIERLLMWCFDKKEMPTIKNCYYDHEIVLLKQFCRELIYNIWFRSKNVIRNSVSLSYTAPAVSLSTKILSTVFVSEEEITNYKKTELVKDESCVRFFCENALKNHDGKVEYKFETLNEFFKFCSNSTDKMEEVKKLIADNIKDWIEKYGVRINRVDIVAPLLSWVYGERAENREMLINHFPNRNEVIFYYVYRGKSN